MVIVVCDIFRQVERERLTAEETAAKSSLQRSALDRTLSSAEQENAELQRQVRTLEQQLASLEQQHLQRLNNITVTGKAGRVCIFSFFLCNFFLSYCVIVSPSLYALAN